MLFLNVILFMHTFMYLGLYCITNNLFVISESTLYNTFMNYKMNSRKATEWQGLQ
jgi:hypothetical protein